VPSLVSSCLSVKLIQELESIFHGLRGMSLVNQALSPCLPIKLKGSLHVL
jgi:hypothetical protein